MTKRKMTFFIFQKSQLTQVGYRATWAILPLAIVTISWVILASHLAPTVSFIFIGLFHSKYMLYNDAVGSFDHFLTTNNSIINNSCNLPSEEKFWNVDYIVVVGKVSIVWKQRVFSQCYKDVFMASNLFHLFETTGGKLPIQTDNSKKLQFLLCSLCENSFCSAHSAVE